MKKVIQFFFRFFLPVLPLIIVIAVYFPVLNANFNYEDAMLIGDSAKALTQGNFGYVLTPWYGNYSRLFWQPIFIAIYAIFKYNATPFFAMALFFHLLNALLTYFIALRITGSKPIAFFSSVLYGTYQVNSEGIIWLLVGIKDVPMTTFFLISLLAFINFLDTKKKIFLITVLISVGICLTTELKAILTPGVLLLYFLFFNRKDSKTKNFKKVFSICFGVVFLIQILLMFTFYKDTPKLISKSTNWQFWQTFFASLPFYVVPVLRIFWIKVYTNAHGITTNFSDELYLKAFGGFLFFLIIVAIFLLFWKKESAKAKILIFLLVATFTNYLPVMLTVFTGYHSLWITTTIHWRYFMLATPTAAILVTSCFFWINELMIKIINPKSVKSFTKQSLTFPFKLLIIPILFLSLFSFWHIESDRIVSLNHLLSWSVPAKKNLQKMKFIYPEFPPNSVLVIEGTADEKLFFYFSKRYLMENIFALYAQPNNTNFSKEQRKIAGLPDNGYDRRLTTLLYYTNLKDLLLGNYGHIYSNEKNVSLLTHNIVDIPTFDRLFIGSIYKYYDYNKVYVLKFNKDGNIFDVTNERRNQLSDFLRYFCFEKEVILANNQNKQKPCQKPTGNYPKNISSIFDLFSDKGKTIIKTLIEQSNNLPELKSFYPN